MLKQILSTLIISTYLIAKSCWTIKEKAIQENAELDNAVIFSFKDAVTCEPISNAKVTFLKHTFFTNQNGELKIPTPPDNMDLIIPLKVEKDGYITLIQKIKANVGTYWQHRFLLSKELPFNSARFVLGWSDIPQDLDLHLVGANFHISYRNKIVSNKANLDRDARYGYGAETITLKEIDNQKYELFIHQYSKKGRMNHKVNLTIYKNNKILKVIHLPDNLKGRCFKVLTIDNKKIKYDLKIVDEKFCK